MTIPDRIPLPYPATLNDLFRIKGKAELIADRNVCYPLMGYAPGHAKMEIASSLHDYAARHPGTGVVTGCVVYAIPQLPNGRQSFCPDVSFHVGPPPVTSWLQGPPTLAVEIRALEDYQSDLEPTRASKRADYFQAGTQVVWDVDPIAETVTKYEAADPLTPVVFPCGTEADAEPALPGWRLKVADIFT